MSALKLQSSSGGSTTLVPANNATDTVVTLPSVDDVLALISNGTYTQAEAFAAIASSGNVQTALTWDAVGNLYWAVDNYYNGTTYNLTSYIYRITPEGVLSTWASVATSGCHGTALAWDAAGNLYWAIGNSFNGTTYNLTSYVYRITPAGVRTTWASVATIGGQAVSLAFDSAGNLYWAVGNYYNGTTYNLTSYVYRITPAGALTTWTSAATNYVLCTDLAFDSAGNLYWGVSNRYNDTTYNLTSYVYRITPAGALTVWASAATKGSIGCSLAFDSLGNLYWAVTNGYDGTLYTLNSYIYRIRPDGTMTTFATQGTVGGNRCKLIFDSKGQLFWAISNQRNNAIYAQTSYLYLVKPTLEHNELITIAEAPTNGASGCDLAFDSAGNLYWAVGNYYNGTTYNLTSYIYTIAKIPLA